MAVEREEVTVQLGMNSAPLKQEAARTSAFMEDFTKKLTHKINHTLMGIFGLDLISTLKSAVESFVDWASSKIAETMFSLEGSKELAQALDYERNLFRKLREEKMSSEKELAELQAKSDFDRLTDLKKIEEVQTRILDASKEIKDLEESGNKREDAVRIAALRVEKLKEELLLETLMKKAHEDDLKTEKERLQNQQHKTKVLDAATKQFIKGIPEDQRKPLDEINAKILEDQRNLALFPNDRNRTDLKIDLERRQKIVSDIKNQLKDSKEQTAAQKLTDMLLGNLVQSGAIKVEVTNVDK